MTGNRWNVLVVEDEADLRETLALALEQESFNVRQACNGREALTQLENADELPHAIVLDLMMPVMSGTAFLREVQARPRLAQIPVVVLSAAVPYMSAPGARVVFRKPASLETLSRALRALVDTQPGVTSSSS